MVDFERKEEQVINNIAHTVEKLDEELDKLDALDESSTKKYRLKKWYAEKKAIHEIKHVLHEVGKYARYDEDEMKKVAKYFEHFED